ncbi:hypothetical protein N7G274_006262 [Stereocaulon virgatum]|uniref:F-box domain-containing protein n=1 Tax=Stereocaulon virgatum TaxID=373712 RepID=A0ABR4A7T8_9LECA
MSSRGEVTIYIRSILQLHPLVSHDNISSVYTIHLPRHLANVPPELQLPTLFTLLQHPPLFLPTANRHQSIIEAYIMPKATRKKQAVTKTNNAKTIALIRKNVETSLLLRLPSEVREKILVDLVGENLIHVKYLIREELNNARLAEGESFDDDHGARMAYHSSSPSRIDDKRIQGAFRHAICVAEQSEHHTYVELIKGYATVSSSGSATFSDEHSEFRHKHCQDICNNANFNALTIDLNVLGVCRQLYEEANFFLWATNIFSFDDPLSFHRFLGSLNPAQKRNITGLHFNFGLGDVKDVYHLNTLEQWEIALRMPYLNMLRGIEYLHLCLEQRSQYYNLHWDNDQSYEWAKKQLNEDLEPIFRLCTLLAKNITVVFTRNAALDTSNLWFGWTAEQKKDYGESIRTRLQDPNDRELLKAEIEARNQQAKLDHAYFSWERALWAEKRATRLELSAKEASDEIETYKDKVEEARKEAMKAARMKLKAADGHQAIYNQSKLDLNAAKLRASNAIRLADRSRATAAKRAAIYQRAEARVGDHAAVAKLNAKQELDTEDDDSSFADESDDEDTEEFDSMSEVDSNDGVRDSDVEMGEGRDIDNESELSDDS